MITNDELVASYNALCRQFNAEHDAEIARGTVEAKPHSSAEFIEKASGISSRFAYVKDGILDPDVHAPAHPAPRRGRAFAPGRDVAERRRATRSPTAGKTAADIDMVIVSCAYTERSYPAIAIEVQHALGIEGFGFDMLVACSAATFALQRAYDALEAGSARGVLVINPELTSPQVNYCDRDSHFIFGDVRTAWCSSARRRAFRHTATAFSAPSGHAVFEQHPLELRLRRPRRRRRSRSAQNACSTRMAARCSRKSAPWRPRISRRRSLRSASASRDIRRWWLHQANLNMNQLITRKLLGTDPTADEAPIVLDRFRQHRIGGFDHRVRPTSRRPAIGRPRRDLLVRRGLFDRQPSGTQALTYQ